jgi:hypothetical protein
MTRIRLPPDRAKIVPPEGFEDRMETRYRWGIQPGGSSSLTVPLARDLNVGIPRDKESSTDLSAGLFTGANTLSMGAILGLAVSDYCPVD